MFLLSFPLASLSAAPKRYVDDQSTIAMREMRATLDDLRHEVGNHEHEINTYNEKIRNIENIVDTFLQKQQSTSLAQREALKDSSTNLEIKINSLDTVSKGLIADFKQLKNHANEIAGALHQYKQKLVELEKMVEIQNQTIESLQLALKSLTDVLQVKSSNPAVAANNVYKVASGDSLEKIARKHQISIQALKEANNLVNDRINVGQTLKIP